MRSPTPSLILWLQQRSAVHRGSVIEEHWYLCRRAARKFIRRGVDRCDLEQVAAIGLIKAVDRYDFDRETPFEAYAWSLVLGELMHYVRDSEPPLRAPRRVRELDRRCLLAERELWCSLGREPSPGEIAQYAGATGEEHREVRCYRESSKMVSFETMRGLEERGLVYTIDHQLDRLMIEGALNVLTPTEREIIREIYERETPIVTLADRLGYSRRHISRLHNTALKKLMPFARPQVS